MGYWTTSGYYWNSREEQDEAIQKAERLVAKLELWSQRREEVGYWDDNGRKRPGVVDPEPEDWEY